MVLLSTNFVTLLLIHTPILYFSKWEYIIISIDVATSNVMGQKLNDIWLMWGGTFTKNGNYDSPFLFYIVISKIIKLIESKRCK